MGNFAYLADYFQLSSGNWRNCEPNWNWRVNDEAECRHAASVLGLLKKNDFVWTVFSNGGDHPAGCSYQAGWPQLVFNQGNRGYRSGMCSANRKCICKGERKKVRLSKFRWALTGHFIPEHTSGIEAVPNLMPRWHHFWKQEVI